MQFSKGFYREENFTKIREKATLVGGLEMVMRGRAAPVANHEPRQAQTGVRIRFKFLVFVKIDGLAGIVSGAWAELLYSSLGRNTAVYHAMITHDGLNILVAIYSVGQDGILET